MLTKSELSELRKKLPRKYVQDVRDAYYKATGDTVSARTIFSFLAGATYSVELHNATLSVAERNTQRMRELKKRTTDIIQ